MAHNKLPDLSVNYIQKGERKKDLLNTLFKGKRNILFAVPGAFTPACTDTHLPGFIKNYAAFKDKNIDHIICLSVNDPFVMQAWAEAHNPENTLIFIADGNGEMTKALKMELDASNFCLGTRSKRYAMLICDGVIEKTWIDEDGKVNHSGAESLIKNM